MKNLLLTAFVLVAAGAAAWLTLGRSDAAGPPVGAWSQSDVETVPDDEPIDGLSIDGGFDEQGTDLRADVAADLTQVADVETIELRISGRVVDQSQAPVSGAAVQLDVSRRGGWGGRGGRGNDRNRVRTSVTTGDDGRFEFVGPGPRDSRLQFQVQHDRFATHVEDRRIEDDSNGRLDVGDLQVVVGGTIVGRVTNAEGNGIADAAVTLSPGGGDRFAWVRTRLLEPAQTDSLGYYEFPHLAPGSYRIAASARGHTRSNSRSPVQARDGEKETADTIVLGPGAVFGGTVFAPSGKPVEGARVRVSARGTRGDRAETDAAGKFEFEHLTPGAFELSVQAEGYLTWEEPEVDPSMRSNLVIQLEAGLTIEGRVIDALTQSPVTAFAAKVQRVRGVVDVDEMQEMRRAMEERLAAMGVDADDPRMAEIRTRIESRITNGDDGGRGGRGNRGGRGEREQTARFGFGRRAPTDLGTIEPREDGKFRFDGLDEGVYVVYVQSPDHQLSETEEIELRRETPRRDTVLPILRGVELQGVVTAKADGRPLPKARVELLAVRETAPANPFDPADGQGGRRRGGRNNWFGGRDNGPRGDRIMQTTTDSKGRFTFEHAPHGSYMVSVTLDGFTSERTDPFDLSADRADLQLGLAPTASIRGTVTGIPADRADEVRVIAFGGFGRGRMRDVRPAADGSYAIEDIQPGDYVVRAFVGEMREYLMTQMRTLSGPDAELQHDVVVAAGGEYTFDPVVDIPAIGSVEGTLIVNGAPAANARVSLREVRDPVAGAGGGFGGRRFGGRNQARTDQAGKFEISGVAAGEYELVVASDGRGRDEMHTERVVVAADNATFVSVRVIVSSVTGSITAPEGAAGSADDLDGSLIILPGAIEEPENLRAYERENRSHRARIRDGAYSLEGVTPGQALVIVSIRGRANSAVSASIREGENTLDFVAGAKN